MVETGEESPGCKFFDPPDPAIFSARCGAAGGGFGLLSAFYTIPVSDFCQQLAGSFIFGYFQHYIFFAASAAGGRDRTGGDVSAACIADAKCRLDVVCAGVFRVVSHAGGELPDAIGS